MTEEERAIWQTAYAVAFMGDYERLRESAQQMPASARKGELPSDMASRVSSAELACSLADLAVRKLRTWRTDESPTVGFELPDADS